MSDYYPTVEARIGMGITADVYAYGAWRVLKLCKTTYCKERVEQEFHITHAVHCLGVPAPAVYDVVEVGGRWGIVMERADGLSLLQRVQRRPWTLFQAARELSELHTRVNRFRAPQDLPAQRDWIARRIRDGIGIAEADRQRAASELDRMPDGDALCHGDFHPENIIYTRRGPIIIDWSTATHGCPASDAASTSLLMQHANLPSTAPRLMHGLMAVFRPWLHRRYLKAYVKSGLASREQIAAWESLLRIAGTVTVPAEQVLHCDNAEEPPSPQMSGMGDIEVPAD